MFIFFLLLCVYIFLPKLAYPAERKRRAEEAQQSSMGNGASAENGASAVTFLSFFLSCFYYIHVFVCVCIIFALSLSLWDSGRAHQISLP